MEKYCVFMTNDRGKEVFAQTWSLPALNAWINYHILKGCKVVRRG